MIYFPYPNIKESYNCLSSKDKKTQLPQAKLILKVIKSKQLLHLTGATYRTGTIGYARSREVLMFQPFESFLILYINTLTLLEGKIPNLSMSNKVVEPFWLKDEKFNLACRKKLFKNSPIDYAQYGWFSSVDTRKQLLAEGNLHIAPIKWTDIVLQGAG